MNRKRNQTKTIGFVVLVIFATTFCSVFNWNQDSLPQPDSVDSTATMTPSPTLAPTNDVKLNDDGAPLPPQILSMQPAGGQELAANGVIRIQFDQKMDHNITSEALTLKGPEGDSVAGMITWPDPDIVLFDPLDPLMPGETYQVSLSADAQSLEKKSLAEALNFEILVASDLRVSQVFPANDTANVENNAVITVIFNRPVVPLMTVEDQRSLPQPLQISPALSGRGAWLNSSVYVFRPDEPMLSSTIYTARVEAGLTDTIGAQLEFPYEWTFSTSAPRVTSFGLNHPVSALNPGDNYLDVRPESSFLINFQQPMNKPSVAEAFSLYSLQGENVPVELTWKSETQVVISPTLLLDMGTDYTFLLTTSAKAETGGTLAEGVRWAFRTLPWPGVEYTYPQDGGSQDRFSSRFSISFLSPMMIDTITDRVVINPQPEEEFTWYYNPWSWSIDYYGLEPSTNYEVTLLPGAEDVYGNPITEEFTFRFRTADYRPAAFLDLPYGPAIYRLDGPMKFYMSYVNVNSVDVSLFQLPAEVFTGFVNGTYNRWDYIPPEDYWVNRWHRENGLPVNKISRLGIPLEDSSGDKLSPGFYFMTISSPEVESYNTYIDSRLIVVSDANLTLKTTPTEALIWLTDLFTGDPLSGKTAVIFDAGFNQIGQGATNSEGLLYLELPPPENSYEGRFALVDDGSFAFAYSDWGSGISPYDFGIWSSFYADPEQPLAYVYTDRPLYRPGQTVSFKGIVRQNDDLAYSMLPWEVVEVEISSYNETVFKETMTLSEFGTFDGEIILDDNAALGYYSINVRPEFSDEGIGGVGFSVAEYRKPEFQISTTAEPENVLAGNEYEIDVFAEYFSGGGVGNADVVWALQAVDYAFQPSGNLSRYNFSDYDRDTDFYYAYFEESWRETIATGKGITNQEGKVSIPLTADLSESGNSQRFTFEATVTDIAGTSVSDRVDVIAHLAAIYPGVRPAKYVGSTGDEQFFEIIVVDWDAEPVAHTLVDVEIVERRWHSVQEQDSQGFVQWTSSVEDIPVAEFTDLPTNFEGKVAVSFVPENGGVYKAKVTTQDEFGNQARAGAYMWISSSDFVAWRQTDDRKMELVVDKEEYQPGEIAEILIASPFDGENYALVTVERGHIRDQEVIRLTSNSAVFRLPITAEMAPNVYVSVLVIQGANSGGKSDFRQGIVALNVSTNQQRVKVEIIPDKESAGPGDTVTYDIRTTDHNGNPVSAEVSLSLADLAALSLSASNSTPILEYFYDQRALGVRTTVPIVHNVEHFVSSLEDRLTEGQGMGSGGGKGADNFGVFDIRGEFKDTAFWKADVRTDENGEATITVTLPDNLTTWRMDARAVTQDTLVGDGENDIRSTKPLLVRPQTPRFFVTGDQALLSAAVHNNTEQTISAEVSLQAEGIELGTTATQNVNIPPGGQEIVSWLGVVQPTVNQVDLVFLAVGGGYSDASRPTIGTTLDDQGIPVYKYEVPETVGTSGMLTENGSRTEGIFIPSEWKISQGDLRVEIAPSLVAGMTDGLDYLEHYKYECVEQTVSRFLPNVLTTQALQAAAISDPALEENLRDQVNVALQRLYNWQRPEGGWGWWPESETSDLQTTSYVVMGLVEAQNAGYHVNAETLARGLDYMKGKIISLSSIDQQSMLNRQAFVLYVLALAGEPQVSQTVQLYDLHTSLSLYARAYLLETLWRIDSADTRLDTLISEIGSAAILSATGTHWEEGWRDYLNWNSDTRTTAIVLASLIKVDPENGLNANAVRWLMTHRTDGHWRTTQETAWSLMTLTNWMVATGELDADYDWAVGLNGDRLGDGSANRETLKEIRELTVDISELFMDEVNRLTVARDTGAGNLYYTAHLNVYLPVDQIEPLDRGIIISREYFNPSVDGNGEPITTAQQGDVLLARLTIIVPNGLHYVVIDDPLPAGLEAVDQSLETSPDLTAPQRYDWQSMWQNGWGWWYFDHVELRDERVVLSADYLPAGTYVYTYIVRASIPGEYNVIPPTAQEFYFPEVYGRGAGSKFIVER